MTAIATLIKFPARANQNPSDADTRNRIETVLRHRLKSLVAGARLACHQISDDERFSLERQVAENFTESQKLSSPQINIFISRIDNKTFQTAAVGIAREIGRGNFADASDIFSENLETATQQTIEVYRESESMKIRFKRPMALAA